MASAGSGGSSSRTLNAAVTAAERARTAVLVNLAMVVEQANEQVLPAVFLFVGRSLNASPSQLGTVTLCRAMVQTFASPLSGILGDKYDRVLVLSSGAFIWGAMTAAMALCATLSQVMVFAAFNGLGLALLVPCCQSLIADLYTSETRGRAFGTMQLTGAFGGMLGGLYATNMGGKRPFGMEGWRFAFNTIAAVSVLTGAAALLYAVDPKRSALQRRASASGQGAYASLPTSEPVAQSGAGSGGLDRGASPLRGRSSSPGVVTLAKAGSAPLPNTSWGTVTDYDVLVTDAPSDGGHPVPGAGAPHQAVHMPGSDTLDRAGAEGDDYNSGKRGRPRVRGVASDILWMLQIKTFQAIVLQGIVGCFPWQAMVFFTLWLQLEGFSDIMASILVAMFGGGVALGSLLGGHIGDHMAARLPCKGRILTAQFSVACGIPLTALLLKGLPNSALAGQPLAYAAVMFLTGLMCCWAGSGCNSPIFAEIVPDDMRSTIYAFDRSFENSIAACAAPVVGLLAEKAFGFHGVLSDEALKDKALRLHNARALGSSLLLCMTVPWMLCLLSYGVLHWTYPKDRARARSWAVAAATGSSGALVRAAVR